MKDFIKTDINIDTIKLCCFVAKEAGTPVHKDRPSYGLAIYTSGKNHYEFEGGSSLAASAGDIVFLPKSSNYVVSDVTDGECYAINFDITQQESFQPFIIHTRNPKDFLLAFERAEHDWRHRKPGFQMRCKASLYHILGQMQKEYYLDYSPRDKNDMIAPAVAYIHENYTHKAFSITALADMCHISPEYFRRIFQKNYGTSPVKYINDLRISHAKELLRSQEYSISDTAFLSGFADLSHFSREFKKATGLSPKDFVRGSRS